MSCLDNVLEGRMADRQKAIEELTARLLADATAARKLGQHAAADAIMQAWGLIRYKRVEAAK